MSERMFTTGPWEVEEGLEGYPDIVSNDYTIVGNEGMFGNIDTDYANAHLMAAAPELLECLEAHVRYLQFQQGDRDEHPQQMLINQSIAAIKKALNIVD